MMRRCTLHISPVFTFTRYSPGSRWDTFKDINDLQGQATNSVEKLLSGETKDVDQVMNKVAEAGVAFDLMLEVKNKVMEAYKQMERMQV